MLWYAGGLSLLISLEFLWEFYFHCCLLCLVCLVCLAHWAVAAWGEHSRVSQGPDRGSLGPLLQSVLARHAPSTCGLAWPLQGIGPPWVADAVMWDGPLGSLAHQRPGEPGVSSRMCAQIRLCPGPQMVPDTQAVLTGVWVGTKPSTTVEHWYVAYSTPGEDALHKECRASCYRSTGSLEGGVLCLQMKTSPSFFFFFCLQSSSCSLSAFFTSLFLSLWANAQLCSPPLQAVSQ